MNMVNTKYTSNLYETQVTIEFGKNIL